MKRTMINRTILAGFLVVLGFVQAYAQSDPLPSWNDGAAKKVIVEFVKTTTDNARDGMVEYWNSDLDHHSIIPSCRERFMERQSAR